jgi:hypothetical protein
MTGRPTDKAQGPQILLKTSNAKLNGNSITISRVKARKIYDLPIICSFHTLRAENA